MNERKRVVREVVYEGASKWVDDVVARSVHGTKSFGNGSVTARTVSSVPNPEAAARAAECRARALVERALSKDDRYEKREVFAHADEAWLVAAAAWDKLASVSEEVVETSEKQPCCPDCGIELVLTMLPQQDADGLQLPHLRTLLCTNEHCGACEDFVGGVPNGRCGGTADLCGGCRERESPDGEVLEHVKFICPPGAHDDDSYNRHCPFCEGGLFHCTVCGAVEGELLPTCPGVKLTSQEKDDCYAGKIKTATEMLAARVAQLIGVQS